MFQPEEALSRIAERVDRDLAQLAEIGRVGETGVRRLAYTKEDQEARGLLVGWMRELGLAVSTDAFGNIRGRLAGRRDDLPPVWLGSHIDTPPLGGRFDGTVGVVGALEVLRLWRDGGLRPLRPVEVVAFQCEEPGRFGVSCLGSKATAGKFGVDYLHSLKDAEGTTLWQAIRDVGLDPDDLPSARMKEGDVHAYLELHIEQGRVLEDAGDAIGIVTAVAGPSRARVRFRGQADHSGATPMSLRRDAACGAAELMVELERLARAEEPNGTVGTVGSLELFPGAINVVPGEARMLVDIRGVDAESKDRVRDAFVAAARRIAAGRRLDLSIEWTVHEPPVPMDARLQDILESACESAGFTHRRMPSGAGHDAQHVAAYAPSAMIFVPSRAGISHAPEEFTSTEEIARGVAVLASAAWRVASEDESRGAREAEPAAGGGDLQ